MSTAIIYAQFVMKGPTPGRNRWASKSITKIKERNCGHEITPQPRLNVMLSGAKHLWISLGPELKPEILRFAQDHDSSGIWSFYFGCSRSK